MIGPDSIKYGGIIITTVFLVFIVMVMIHEFKIWRQLVKRYGYFQSLISSRRGIYLNLCSDKTGRLYFSYRKIRQSGAETEHGFIKKLEISDLVKLHEYLSCENANHIKNDVARIERDRRL
ncbi:MAG: hypothetical protein R3E95_19390 [Thiolinea sp.]